MKYNYVVFGNGSELYKISYADLNNNPNAVYLTGLIDTNNGFLKALFKLHNSDKLNGRFKLPGRNVWNKFVFKNPFSDDKPICFVFRSFLTRIKNLEAGIISYLRAEYPDCKIVIFCQDLVRFEYDIYRKYIDEFDLAISFDQDDAQKYNMLYYPLVYSNVTIPESDSVSESDVYFLGKAKDRFDFIIESYELLKNAGLSCDFNIVGVPEEKQKYRDEINYCEKMPYLVNVQHIKKTKCMLEIMQGGGHGYTQRYAEAIMYDKKLITNNVEIINAPFYSDKIIQCINKPSDINPEFVNSFPLIADYHFKEQLSPNLLLEFIDSHLVD